MRARLRRVHGGRTTVEGLFGGDDPLVSTADRPWRRHDAMRLDLQRPLAAATHLIDLRRRPVALARLAWTRGGAVVVSCERCSSAPDPQSSRGS